MRLSLVAVSVLVLAGCAADVADGSVDAENEEIRLRSGYRYDCTRNLDGTTEHVDFVITSKGQSGRFVQIDDDGRARTGRYGFDASYAPKTNKSYSRFNRSEDVPTAGSILALSTMLEGSTSGAIKLQDGGDAFTSTYYRCTRTYATIDTGEPKAQLPSAAVMSKLAEDYYADPPGGLSRDDGAHWVYSLFLRADGTYRAYNTDGRAEMGVWTASGSALPMTISLRSGRYAWTATLSAGGKLRWKRGALQATLAAVSNP
jgi:hypothetical protein